MHQQPFRRSKTQREKPRLVNSGGGPKERRDDLARSGSTTPMDVLDTDSTNQTAGASEIIDDDAEVEDVDAHDHDADILGGIEHASDQASLSKSWSGHPTLEEDAHARTRSNYQASDPNGRPESSSSNEFVSPDPFPGQSSRVPHSAAAHDTPPASLAFGSASPLSSIDISPLNPSDVSFELFEAPPGWKGEVDDISTELCGSPRRKKVRNDNVQDNGNEQGPFQRLLEDEPNYPTSPCANRCDKGKDRAVQLQIDDLREKLDELSKRFAQLSGNQKGRRAGNAPDISTEGRATEGSEQDTKSQRRKVDLRSSLRRLETSTLIDSKLLKEDVAGLRDGQERLLDMFDVNRREVLKLKKAQLYARSKEHKRALHNVVRPSLSHREDPEETEGNESSLTSRRNAIDSDIQSDFPEPGHAGRSRDPQMLSPNEDSLDYFSWSWPSTGALASEPSANSVADLAPPPSVGLSREIESRYPGMSPRTESQRQRSNLLLHSRSGRFRIPFRNRADLPESSSTAPKREHGHDRESLPPLHLTSPAISPRSSHDLTSPAEVQDHGMLAQSSPPMSPRIRTMPSAAEAADYEMLSPASPMARPALDEFGRRESDDFYAGRSNVFPPMTPEWCAHHARTHPHGCDSMVDCMVCRSHGHGGPRL